MLTKKRSEIEAVSAQINKVSAEFETFLERVGSEINDQVSVFFLNLKQQAQNYANVRTNTIGELNSFKAMLNEIAADGEY